MAASTRPTTTIHVGDNIEVEVYTDVNPPVATMNGVKSFFGHPALGAKEIIALKKDELGNVVHDGTSDWDKISRGIGDGTLTY